MNLMGLVAGLGVGLALAALLEYRDTTLRTEDDVLVTLSVPVLALVPEIATSRERSLERKRRKWLSLGGAAVVAIAAVAAAAYRLGWLAGWV
jgi:hypothetical protein